MPVWLQAGLWGLLGASSLVLGAAVAYLARLPQRVTAGVMAFGCGVLISAVAYDLLEAGFQEGGIWPIALGAVAGSIAYTVADWLVSPSYRTAAHEGNARWWRRTHGSPPRERRHAASLAASSEPLT